MISPTKPQGIKRTERFALFAFLGKRSRSSDSGEGGSRRRARFGSAPPQRQNPPLRKKRREFLPDYPCAALRRVLSEAHYALAAPNKFKNISSRKAKLFGKRNNPGAVSFWCFCQKRQAKGIVTQPGKSFGYFFEKVTPARQRENPRAAARKPPRGSAKNILYKLITL